MPSAELIAIGTELLLGEIQDTNTKYLARSLRDLGIDLYRSTLIGDNLDRIASSIRESLGRADIVITTGGLGPTVDDPTREAVALYLGVGLEFHEELWQDILARFTRHGWVPTENNRKQAYLPIGAKVIENPVGTAPAFYVQEDQKIVISLPGVPREMEFLYENNVKELLRSTYSLKQTIFAKVLHSSGVGESQVDEWIAEYETHANPTVGILAHANQVDVRITAKANSVEEAKLMIEPIAADIITKLDDGYYGSDETRLEDVVAEKLTKSQQSKIIFKIFGENDTELERRLESVNVKPLILSNPDPVQTEFGLQEKASQLQVEYPQTIVVVASVESEPKYHQLRVGMLNHQQWSYKERKFGDSSSTSGHWVTNAIFDFLRRNL